MSNPLLVRHADMEITLSWPPSVNTYWRTPHKGPLAGRTMISEKGRAYREAVIKECAANGATNADIEGRLSVTLLVFPPDRRRRDIDNIPKAVLDALAHAGVYRDDSQIDELVIRRCSIVQDGGVRVEIRRIDEVGAAA